MNFKIHFKGMACLFENRHRRIREMLTLKILLTMKLIIILIVAFSFTTSANSFSQQVSLSVKKANLENVMQEVRKQSGYAFIFNSVDLKQSKAVTAELKNASIELTLNTIFDGQPFIYEIKESTIVVKLREEKSILEKLSRFLTPPITVVGRVVDSLGKPLAGVSVKVKGRKLSTSTNQKGEFTLNGVEDDRILVISYLGHVSRELKPLANLGDIVLSVAILELKEVQVNTGMFSRNKETFTGVTRTISGKDLRAASRQNILEGINMLDPSFKIVRDNNLGSDPNQLPKIEMRGSRTLSPPTEKKYSQQLKLQYEQDPNQPLFILDGFETSLTTIVNLDVNRIASVTLLKDAASTALYGSRSANGVVVVETIRPTPGEMRVSYGASANFSMPDLNGYNMMDAKELLKFQELTSIGSEATGPFSNTGNALNFLPKLKHAFRENAILNDINSDWKNVPLQHASALNHILNVSGGDSYFTYNVGLTKGSNIGVMKGSENSTTSGYAILMYRKGKINVSNNLNLNGRKQNASPFGSFSDYVKIPPYYRVNNTDRYLEDQKAGYFTQEGYVVTGSYQFDNPLYNANLPYRNSVKGFALNNDLVVNWDVLPFLRISGGFQYSKSNDHSDYFISALHTQFDGKEANQKGSYNYSSSNAENYSGFLTLTYNKVLAEKHILNMNVRSDMKNVSIEGQNISAVGFATTSEPLIYLANSYTPDGRPGGSTSKQNSMALIGSLNYSYDMKYNLDLSYNLSGTSNFGSDNPYQSFYAMGVRWNIGRESFLENSKVVNALSLSVNFGLTGNQNAGNFGSRSTYILNNDPSFFGESLQLKGLGNPNLDWTKTYNLSYSLSGIFFNNVLSVSLLGYRNLTDPMIITIPSPPSVGLPEGIPKNAGKLISNGLELIADARLVNTRDWTFNIGLTSPLFYKSEYSGLGKTLEKFNESARKIGYLQRYLDGASPDDVWAVRSIGIGQARGFEVYLDKNGKYTYVYDKNNEVVIGSSRPKIQGVVNLRTRYKRFTLAVYSRYIFQEMKFNNALYNKVENISPAEMEYNQDKRALYLRWQNPGDDASFLGIKNRTQGMSSRFLQKENAFYIDAINFNYDLIDQYSEGLKSVIRKKLGLQSITFGVTTSNIFQFRLSNIKLERGLDYPFQRTINFNVNLTF